MRKLLLILCAGVALAAPAQAGERCSTCRYDVQIVSIYDGDTFRIELPGLPAELNPVGVRVRGVDTPELRGKCQAEKQLAERAKQFTINHLNRSAGYVRIGDLEWDKYGGRVDADVYLGPQRQSLASLLIQAGLARPYNGGRRGSWC